MQSNKVYRWKYSYVVTELMTSTHVQEVKQEKVLQNR